MQTLVRVFFDDGEVKGWVIPDHDEELDEHHKTLIDAPHDYIDLPNDEFFKHRYNGVGGIDKFKLHDHIKAKQ